MTDEERNKKLYSLPWQALYDYARGKCINEDSIKGKEKREIIECILALEGISDLEIESLVNNYIYGSRVTFTLWGFEKELTEYDFDNIQSLEGNEIECNLRGFRKLKISSVTSFANRKEVLYVYSKEYIYTDEEGRGSSIWEQHKGCIWLGVSTPYLASISKHEKMSSHMVYYLAKIVHKKINQIKPPKKAIDRCIEKIEQSRIVLQGLGGEKTTISNSEGFTEEQHQEVDRLSNNRFDASGSYISQIEDGITATVKYNMKKGSIGIQKHLPASVLFDWTEKAIEIIFQEIEELKGQAATEIYKSLGLELKWEGLCVKESNLMNWILTQVLAFQHDCTKSTVQVPKTIMPLFEKSQLFNQVKKCYCSMCESYETPICDQCGRPLRIGAYNNMICDCGAPANPICSAGHRLSEILPWYIPKQEFYSKLYKNIAPVLGGRNQKVSVVFINDIMYLFGDNSNDNCEVEISFSDITCFASDSLPIKESTRRFAVNMNEKCDGGCSKTKIEKCVKCDTMYCLPKIFFGIIPGFRPQPHKGGEYGDASGQVQVGNVCYDLIAIIKKNSKNTKSKTKSYDVMVKDYLLSTTKEGQEIIRQMVEQGLIDNRVGLIAIVAPQYIDSSFKATLRFLAKLGEKKVMFIELDQICQLLMMNDSIALPE